MTAPLVPIALVFALGVWLGLEVTPRPWLLPVGVWLALLALAAAWRHRLAAASLAVLALVGLAGWGRVGLPDPLPGLTGLRPGPTVLVGIASGDPETEGPRTRLPLVVRAAAGLDGLGPASGQLLVHLYGPPPAVLAGHHVRIPVVLSEPRSFQNPGDRPILPGQLRRHPRYLATGTSAAVERLPDGPTPWWLSTRLAIRSVLRRHLPPVSSALLEGLLIGERRQLPASLLEDFRRAGVFHVLAISGFNVALVAGCVFATLRLLRVPPRGAAAGALGALAGFAAVVGPQSSVLRATVMGGLFLGARLVGREALVWNSLAAALLTLLALDPESLVEPGFQLSFAATAGILHLAPPIRRRLAALPPPLALALAVSAGAQLGVTPVMLAWWNELSLIGVVANLVVVPLAGVLTMLGFVALLITTMSEGLGHLVFSSVWALLVALRLVARAFAALPGAVIYVPSPPPLALAAAAGAVGLAPLAARWKARLAVAGLAATALALTVVGALPDGRLRILALDVGQGDAILVRGPDGRTLLVDTGGAGVGRLDRGERVVLPVLRRLGIRRLDALAVTHGDPDHAGGLVALLAGVGIDEAWVPAGTEAEAWQTSLVRTGTRRRILARGDRIWLGPLLVTALHPPPVDSSRAAAAGTPNERSLILRLEWGLFAALLTGDAGDPTEQQLVQASLPLEAPLLKVGHHGSRGGSSPGFLAAVGARVAVVSVGARNPFGHPHPAVLARLADAGALVYRTDLDGAIEVSSDAARLTIRRYGQPTRLREFLLRGGP